MAQIQENMETKKQVDGKLNEKTSYGPEQTEADTIRIAQRKRQQQEMVRKELLDQMEMKKASNDMEREQRIREENERNLKIKNDMQQLEQSAQEDRNQLKQFWESQLQHTK